MTKLIHCINCQKPVAKLYVPDPDCELEEILEFCSEECMEKYEEKEEGIAE